ncbi:MAG TPA: hypothetical protein VGV59_01100 [Pyrinomonadaceae bacterium]|nr:hypothetical protein [Pyrinomonadaceae bacterium]
MEDTKMEAASRYTVPAEVARYRMPALGVGVVALLLSAGGALIYGPVQFFRSYLVGFFFCTGLAVGSLAILMLQHMAGGAWGLIIRRILEAATRTIPLLALLGLPIIVSLFVHPHGHALYEWSNHEYVASDDAMRHKSAYLNIPFFIARYVFYFAVWFGLVYFLNRWSVEQDHTGDPRVRRKLQDLSGPGLLLFGLTVTFASIDWGMSLEPHWFSTIYGLIVMAGWGLSALAFTITMAAMLARHGELANVYQPRHFHDYGKLLLAFVMLFAYFSFSQFLITWSGNLPEEIPFYLRRLRGGWQYVGLAIILFHFALPFALLLSRDLKRSGRTLRRVAVLLLVMRVIDLIFLFAPAATPAGQPEHGAGLNPVDFLTMFLATIGVGGIWLWYFLGQLAARPLVPLGAPELEGALSAAGAHH